jgi:chemosensory pili system protein ChpA (sensor histidine kinase/response regulator)
MAEMISTPLALVVDDELTIRELVAEILTKLGFQALAIAEPEAVVELAAAHRPTVILLDIVMRGLDGYAVATRLRGDPRTEKIPIIFITGQDAPIYRTLSFGVGAVAHLQKPFTMTTLRDALGQALEE